MATATSSVPNAGSPSNSTTPAGRPALKSSNTGGSNPGNRRSTQSPVDGPQRRNSHKAWQNSPQQKYNGNTSNSSSPTPGQAAAMRARTPGSGPAGETDTHDRHMHDRTTFVLSKIYTKPVTLTVKTGTQYTGICAGVDTKGSDLSYTLKWTKLYKSPFVEEDKAKEGEYVGKGPEKVMIFDGKEVVDVEAKDILLGDSANARAGHQNGGFKTDTDISGHQGIRERELHRWQPDESTDSGLGLEDPSSKANGTGWDQFAANEKMFGVRSDYDENIYTTKLDRSHPEYQRREAAAAKIAAEIEGQSTTGLSAHIAEERGITVDDSGMDEEDKYSGVQRLPSGNPNKYTPPARRAPTSQPTVPGAPHDPAIISSQLVRPDKLQSKPPAQIVSQPAVPLVSVDPPTKTKEVSAAVEGRLPGRGLPHAIQSIPHAGLESPQIEKDLSSTFKHFVTTEKERVKKKRADMAHRDRASKLTELKRFSETFKLKTEVPQDLVPILAKDKQKQAEIIEKAKKDVQAVTSGNTSATSTPNITSSMAVPAVVKHGNKVIPANSFAAKDPERFQREIKALVSGFPRLNPPAQSNSIAQAVRGVQRNPNLPVRAPLPIPDAPRQTPPTGPSANNHQGPPTAPSANAPHGGFAKRLNVNARPFDFKPNPNAATFTPGFGGASTAATPSPTASAPVASRATSPTIFFGKKVKTEKKSIKEAFNPFQRMKQAKANAPPNPRADPPVGNANDYIDKPWQTQPLWPTVEANAEKSYTQMFAKVEYDQAAGHNPQPPHMMAPQPHHQQLPQHMPHMNHGHIQHQGPHGPMPQHLGIPAHYEQGPGQMPAPSVMPSPSLHNATVAPYQQSPVPHQAQMAMYPGGPGGMNQYGAPAGPQFNYYNNGYPRGGPGGSPMVMHAQGPGPYPPGQMGGQFVHPQHMYSPQPPHTYMNGPPPPGSQGYPSPGRPAPMMMHQGSSQGTPGGVPPMVPYGMQGQNGPMYGQQSEFIPPNQNWQPQRSQSTVPFASTVSSPRLHHQAMALQPSVPIVVGAPAGTPTMLSPSLAAFASPTPSTANTGVGSQPLQRSQTSNKALDNGEGSRGMGRGGRGGFRGGNSGGRGGRSGSLGHAVPIHPGAPGGIGRGRDQYFMGMISNDGSSLVGMMRGQPPHHQGPPPPQFYQQGPHPHYPPGGRGYGGPAHQPGPHGMPPQGPQQQMPPQAPPQAPQQPLHAPPTQPAAQQTAENTPEESK